MPNNEPATRWLSAALGAEITGLSLSGPSARNVSAELFDALNMHGLVLVRDQQLDLHGFASVARQLGPLQRFRLMQPRPGKQAEHYSCPGEPDVTLIGNVKPDGMPDPMATSAEEDWHFDDAYKPRPNRYTVLYAVETPKVGGDTVFAGMQAAYAALDGDTKARIDDLKGVYSVERLYAFFRQTDPSRPPLRDETITANPPVSHPVVRVHPHTARKGLFVVPKVMSRIEGLSEKASVRVAQPLFEHAVGPDFQYRHEWRDGDFLIWDNLFVMHTATRFDAQRDRRLLYRTMVADQ